MSSLLDFVLMESNYVVLINWHGIASLSSSPIHSRTHKYTHRLNILIIKFL